MVTPSSQCDPRPRRASVVRPSALRVRAAGCAPRPRAAPVERAAETRVAPPQPPRHRRHTQYPAADDLPERQAVAGRDVERERDAGEEHERHHQPDPHAHPEGRVALGEVGDLRQRDPEESEDDAGGRSRSPRPRPGRRSSGPGSRRPEGRCGRARSWSRSGWPEMKSQTRYHAATMTAPSSPVATPSRTVECSCACMRAPANWVTPAKVPAEAAVCAKWVVERCVAGHAPAGTAPVEPLEGVDPGPVPVAPHHPESVGADERDRDRAHVGRHCGSIQQAAPAHLVHAGGAGTGEPERPGRVERGRAALGPFDERCRRRGG